MPLDIVASVCPHDCPSACALEVERIEPAPAEVGERRIGDARGSVVVHARAFDGLQTRVVIVEGLWPNYAFEEGIGVNLLTSADPGPPRGGAVFHDTSVWLSPA